MSRSSSAQGWSTLGMLVLLVAVFALSIVTPGAADAQDPTDATIAMSVSPGTPEQTFRTLAVSIDPGSSPLAALGATLRYDADHVLVTGCEVSEAGACHAAEGEVKLSVFNLSGIRANDQLLTVNFEPIGAESDAQFAFTVDTAVDFASVPLAEILVEPLNVEFVELAFGSLTGDVVLAESQSGAYAMSVCVTNMASQTERCTTTTGLGTWRLDDLVVGDYAVAVTDPAGDYAAVELAATVVADEVIAGFDATLIVAADTEIVESETETEPTAPIARENTPEADIVYAASISGRVSVVDNSGTLTGVQVCATQPLVLHQSCSTTNANGEFALDGLSTGNYWLTVVDSLGRFEEATPTLVGVVGDAVRDGVRLRLVRTGP